MRVPPTQSNVLLSKYTVVRDTRRDTEGYTCQFRATIITASAPLDQRKKELEDTNTVI